MEAIRTEKLEQILSRIQEFVRTEIYPLEKILLQAGFRALLPTLQEKREQVKAMGLWAPHLPAAVGGLGLPLAQFARISEELGRSPLGLYTFNCQAPDVGNMEILHKFGTKAQKERFLKPLVRGQVRSFFSMTEPEHAGSNLDEHDGGKRRGQLHHRWPQMV